MTAKRKAVQDLILSTVKKIDDKGKNVKNYQALFKSLNDKQFSEFMERVRNGSLHIILPNGTKTRDISYYESVANSLGTQLFKHVEHKDKDGYFIPHFKYMVGYTYANITKQSVDYALKTPAHTRSRNAITNQVTGESRGAAFSNPEIKLKLAHGLKNTVYELAILRSGDPSFAKFIERYGDVTIEEVDKVKNSSRAVNSLKGFLAGMHIKLKTDKQKITEIRKK